ncbi:MAG: protein-export membrane protein SecF [Parcubacteria group bacterium CG1_02_42_13]|uniref:Protein-export membrane protein SecF n=1 Tax=Candidatus Colwellbacteria bacterium CG23_combo_of_CG06-09_8_20_14_all_42_19 TaxID=1974541 RepID=A0A2H0ALH1_9BACT|nr:MAG: protein-export membrane protein SecF [Parcubacteria group bacterium CG1_02_42_13]PIP46261.1 MAG: protein translocase subunit SecF [Candidatus Colwellbacteria bacterium CG23_combo_of_CG06-09_8_20_14_all_42_19]
MFNVIGHKNVFFGISTAFIVLSIVSMLVFGFRLGVDFTGGTLWQIKIPGTDAQKLEEFFRSNLGLQVSGIAFDRASDIYAVTLPEIPDSDRQIHFGTIEKNFSGAEDFDFQRISPSVSKELRSKSITAVILVMVVISLYIAFVFRKVSRPVSSWKYGIITLITLAHDVIIPAGVFAILGNFIGVAVDSNFIVALLMVMGFSVHDTIVVFDRIRENLTRARDTNMELDEIVNKSVNETFARSINTSLTLVFVLFALYFWGPVGLQYFVLTILIGTVVGTYSSIFVASPLLVVIHRLSRHSKI